MNIKRAAWLTALKIIEYLAWLTFVSTVLFAINAEERSALTLWEAVKVLGIALVASFIWVEALGRFSDAIKKETDRG